jgi:hypothetical protein
MSAREQMKTILLAAALIATALPASAATYTYACKVNDGPKTHLHSAALDLTKHTITWRGKVYRNVKQFNCEARACFGDGNRISLNTATQGVATLGVLSGTAPGADGIEEFECDLVIPK